MTDTARARKLADRIRVVVAETLETDVKDPRLGFVTVTAAKVTPDLREATVFYTVFGDDVARADTAAALESARGVVRAEIGRQCRLRFVPSLTFVADVVPETGRQIDDLVAAVRASDAEKAAAAANAVPAGDADPYRHDDDTEPAEAAVDG
ncbi:MAG: 30S ribosome-binding factor RbfA [Mycobacteriales bacterium]